MNFVTFAASYSGNWVGIKIGQSVNVISVSVIFIFFNFFSKFKVEFKTFFTIIYILTE
jgi:hypothetical protein